MRRSAEYTAATRSGGFEYRASTAQWHAERNSNRPNVAKLAANEELRQYVQDRLAGTIAVGRGATVGPEVHWNGRRLGRRQDRRWATAWSPEQISERLKLVRGSPRSHRVLGSIAAVTDSGPWVPPRQSVVCELRTSIGNDSRFDDPRRFLPVAWTFQRGGLERDAGLLRGLPQQFMWLWPMQITARITAAIARAHRPREGVQNLGRLYRERRKS